MQMDRNQWIKPLILLAAISFCNIPNAFGETISVPGAWLRLKPILLARVNQKTPKMKLSLEQATSFAHFLTQLSTPLPELQNLQQTLPKTTLELLRAIYERNLAAAEADKMAAYLSHLQNEFKFQNLGAFDENTSHIIGREWPEIDYSGEGMTWQKQQQKYLPYGITDFKSVAVLTKFFRVESTLPYFKKIYRPLNPEALRLH